MIIIKKVSFLSYKSNALKEGGNVVIKTIQLINLHLYKDT